MKNTILLLFFVCSTLCSFSQKDTIVNTKRFTHQEYYADGKILAVGNHLDSIKSGDWIYFKKDGQPLAYGKYIYGIKIGKWLYFDKSEKLNVDWKKQGPSEKMKINELGELEIYDVVFPKAYKNGRPVSTAQL